MIPPPIAVVIPRTPAPNISISFFMAVSAPDKEKDITPKISIIKETKFIVSPITNFVLLPERFFSFENCFFGSAPAHSAKCYHETVFVPESVTSSVTAANNDADSALQRFIHDMSFYLRASLVANGQSQFSPSVLCKLHSIPFFSEASLSFTHRNADAHKSPHHVK
jgi:hypothetical protein